MKTVKCLAQDYPVRKSSIPSETLLNFTLFNYKSNGILSQVADIPA